jgi:chloride channel 3/4/5
MELGKLTPSRVSLVNCPRMRVYGETGVVADQPDHMVSFHSMYWPHMMTSSFSSASLADDVNIRERGADPFDFSVYMDKAPLTIQNNSPMELVHQLFVKLGARYVVITDADGLCGCFCHVFVTVLSPLLILFPSVDEGIIDKKTLLAFLNEMESKA